MLAAAVHDLKGLQRCIVGTGTGAEAPNISMVVMTEAASGLRLSISNDGWHAVDLWERNSSMIWYPSLSSMSMQPDPLPGGTEIHSRSIVGRRDATTWKRGVV
jgi:hypothetical protein